MLAIQSSGTRIGKCTPNVIPCRIHHTGPSKISKRYWAPTTAPDGAQTAFFRGRKLRGRVVKLPSKYQGLILRTTEKVLPQPSSQSNKPTLEDDGLEEVESEDDSPEQVKVLETVSSFDELLVWGHDKIPSADDAFVKNIQEWIDFAEAIHANTSVSKTALVDEGAANEVEE